VSARITIDFDQADIEIARLSEALAEFKDFAACLYEITEPVLMTDDLPFGGLDKALGFRETHSTEVFSIMKSDFVGLFEKLFRGLRRDLSEKVLKNLDTYYNNLAVAMNTMQQTERENQARSDHALSMITSMRNATQSSQHPQPQPLQPPNQSQKTAAASPFPGNSPLSRTNPFPFRGT
jgi:hypothetical protein